MKNIGIDKKRDDKETLKQAMKMWFTQNEEHNDSVEVV